MVNTFEWVSLKIMFFSLCPAKLRAYVGERAEDKIRRADAFVILLVTIVTLFSDLAVAVITGCLFSAFMFAMETGNTLRCDTELVKDPKTGEVLRKIYTVRGPLFFGSVTQFLDLFNVMEDPVDNVLRFEDSPTAICDFSALEALNRLTHRYKRFDKSIQVEKLTCTMSTKLSRRARTASSSNTRPRLSKCSTAALRTSPSSRRRRRTSSPTGRRRGRRVTRPRRRWSPVVAAREARPRIWTRSHPLETSPRLQSSGSAAAMPKPERSMKEEYRPKRSQERTSEARARPGGDETW